MRLNPHKADNYVNGVQEYFKHYQRAIFAIVLISLFFNFSTSIALGIKAVILIFVAGFTAIQSEYLFYFHTKNYSREKTKPLIKESKPYIDGVLIALLLPIGTPVYVIILSVLFANYIVKNSFGGYSYNLFSVAITGYLFATISFGMSVLFDNTFTNVILKNIFGLPQVASYQLGNSVGLLNDNVNQLLFANPQLYLGYIPVILLLLILGYLVYTKTIDYIIPSTIFVLLFTLSALVDIFYGVSNYAINNITIGYVAFATIILAADRSIIPKSKNGRIYYSIIIVFVTLIIRELTENIDGILYAIMFATMFVPMLNAKSGNYSSKSRVIIWFVTAIFIVCFIIFTSTELTHDLDPTKTEIQYYEGGLHD